MNIAAFENYMFDENCGSCECVGPCDGDDDDDGEEDDDFE